MKQNQHQIDMSIVKHITSHDYAVVVGKGEKTRLWSQLHSIFAARELTSKDAGEARVYMRSKDRWRLAQVVNPGR